MTTLFYSNQEFVIGFDQKVIFVNPCDLQIFKEIELPKNLLEHGLKPFALITDEGNNNYSDDKTIEQTTNNKIENPRLKNAIYSSDHRLFAVTTSGQKALLIYQCRPENAKLISVRPIARVSTAIAFSADSKIILVTDKSGDCYQYDCKDLNALPKLLFTHTSIVMDISWSWDTKHIISCDRDNKIRLTNYPETWEIHGYCLGHGEFVSGLSLLKDTNVLVSVSGDKSLRLWNIANCKELTVYDLNAAGLRVATRKRSDTIYEIAVLTRDATSNIILLEAEINESAGWTISLYSEKNIVDGIASNICFVDERIFVLISSKEIGMKLIETSYNKIENQPNGWMQMVEDCFVNLKYEPEDISNWFKKRYDNLSDYYDRKRQRIDAKKL